MKKENPVTKVLKKYPNTKTATGCAMEILVEEELNGEKSAAELYARRLDGK